MKKGRKDFIKKLHDGAWSGIKKEIEKEFPKLFKEVEQALIKEAKKRGFKKGVRFTCLYNKFIVDDCHPMLCSEGYLWIKGGCVFRDGKWATIIKETITKEQAEKELGKTILN